MGKYFIGDNTFGEPGNEGSFTPLEVLELSVRSYMSLTRAGVDSVEKLEGLSEDELRFIKNLGRKSLDEIKKKLSDYRALVSKLPMTAKNYSVMLDQLIGLDEVKNQVRRITAYGKMKKDLMTHGRYVMPITLNMGFVGNPGTAKTTVARILAGIFFQAGILKAVDIVEVGRADLIGGYTGQTAIKVKSVFSKAKGRLLFIDEAYSLIDDREGGYGDEAINTIVQEMENNRDDTIVIFAGYPDKMDEFFSRNPGLRSRVPFMINFSDYLPGEMLRIVEAEAEKRGFDISDQAKDKVLQICESAANSSENGNGRFCRNLVENAVLEYAVRIYGENVNETAGDFELMDEDFELPGNLKQEEKGVALGFQV